MDKNFDISKFFMKNEEMKEKISSIPAEIYNKPVKINDDNREDGVPKKEVKYLDDLYSDVFLDVYFKS